MSILPHLPFGAELVVFVACAVAIWVAGIFLSNYTDILADRLHLGQALGGLILLAVATNLPEIAITYSAAASGQLDVAVSNILGGIAIQTVVLVALDAFGVRERRPLTYQAASLTLVIEGAVVLAVLVVVVMGTQLPKEPDPLPAHARCRPDRGHLGGRARAHSARRPQHCLGQTAARPPTASPSHAGIRRPRAPRTPHGEA